MLHLCNTLLVFSSILLLTDNTSIAFAASLLFGVHPLHVESVVWGSELKDLLYAFFFLASVICYLKYISENRKGFFALSLLLFLLSLLSKAMAASLPVALLVIDFLRGRKFTAKVLLENLPFLFLAIVLGIVALKAQHSDSAIHVEVAPFPRPMIYASYGFITYIIKILLPLQQSAYYPYPANPQESVPVMYFIYIPLLILFIGFVFYSLRFTRKVFFGVAFYAATVFLVLQLVPVGGTIISERYSYIPSIGILYIAAEGLNRLWTSGRTAPRIAAGALLAVFVLFFSAKTNAQSRIWKSDLTLWSDVIGRYDKISLAYLNRGLALEQENRSGDAVKDFSKAIELRSNYPKAYNSRGISFYKKEMYAEAMSDFSRAIEQKPDYANAYINRGNVFSDEKRYREAMDDYNRAIALEPASAMAYYNRALAESESGKMERACADFRYAGKLGYALANEALSRTVCP
jgi:protein O-mannosyl-transferase